MLENIAKKVTYVQFPNFFEVVIHSNLQFISKNTFHISLMISSIFLPTGLSKWNLCTTRQKVLGMKFLLFQASVVTYEMVKDLQIQF